MFRRLSPHQSAPSGKASRPAPLGEGISKDPLSIEHMLGIALKAGSGIRLGMDEEAHLFKVIGLCQRELDSCSDEDHGRKAWICSVRRRAQEAVIASSQSLIRHIADQMFRQFHPRRVRREDLIQAGNLIILEKVIPKFEPERGLCLSTYSNWWIKHAMRDEISRNEFLVKPAQGRGANTRAIESFVRDYISEHGRMPEPEEVSYSTGIGIRTIERTLERERGKDQARGSMEISGMIMDLPDARTPRPDERMEEEESVRLLMRLLGSLSPKQGYVVSSRFGLGGQEMTLQQIGKRLSLTRERVRQIEAQSLERMRRKANAARCPDEVPSDAEGIGTGECV